MLKTFTETEMLDYWKRKLGLKASHSVGGEDDKTELDRRLLDEIDLWYDDMLATAPVDRLPTIQLADSVAARYLDDNSAEIILPERAMRLVNLRMKEWTAPEVEEHSVYSDLMRLQHNRLTRASVDEPAVFRRPGRLEVHGLSTPPQVSEYPDSPKPLPTATPSILSLEMVMRPENGTYIVDTALLRRSNLTLH